MPDFSKVPALSTGKPSSEKKFKEDTPIEDSETKDKYVEVYELLLKGVPVSAIAKRYSVDRSTIYRWKQRAVELYREQLETTPVVDIVVDHLAFFDQIEQMQLYEAQMLKSDGKVIDERTGEVISQGDPLAVKKAKMDFIKAAVNTRKTKVDLQVTAGIIPKQAERIYTSIDREKQTVESSEGKIDRTREEITNQILSLVSQSRSISE